MALPVLRELGERLDRPHLCNCYGQTETEPLAAVLCPEEHDEERLASVGRPVLSVAARVVYPEMNYIPPHKAGEILLRSPHLLSGYWESLRRPKKPSRAAGSTQRPRLLR